MISLKPHFTADTQNNKARTAAYVDVSSQLKLEFQTLSKIKLFGGHLKKL